MFFLSWLVGCSSGTFDDPEASLDEGGPCRHPLSENQRDELDYRCAVLTVPELREDPDEPVIELPILVLQHKTIASDAPPVIYLAGGPGGSTWDYARGATRGFVEAYGRPVIVLEQRGAPLALPSLECWYDTDGCAEEYRDRGIRTAAYNLHESAGDVCSAIDLLGYEQAVLHGVSYGTALAQEVMRTCPERIAAAWLDGVVEIDRPWSTDLGANFQAALERVFLVCRSQPACLAAYPDLPARWAHLLDTLPEEPQDGVPYTRGVLIDVFFGSLYDPGFARFAPALIYLFDEQRWDEVGPRITAALEGRRWPRDPASDFAYGMFWAMSCNEDLQYIDLGQLAASHAALHPVVRDHFVEQVTRDRAACGPWGQRPKETKRAATEDIPVLVTGGGFDPITPIAGAERVAAQLPRGVFVPFLDSGHGLLYDGCAMKLWMSFLEHPERQPEKSCAGDSRVEFVIER